MSSGVPPEPRKDDRERALTGEQHLRWTGQDLQFVGQPGFGDPVAIGSDQAGPGAKPSDLLPLSLAACTAHDVVVILRKQRQDLRGLEVITTTEQDPDLPFTFRRISMRFVLHGRIDVRKAERAINLSHGTSCSVAATLAPVVEMDVSFEVVAPVEGAVVSRPEVHSDPRSQPEARRRTAP